MGVYYSGKYSVDFWRLEDTTDENKICKNSFRNFGLITAKKLFVNPYDPYTNVVDLPRSNDRLIVTGGATGDLSNKMRVGEWEFYIDHDKWPSWLDCYRALVEYLHGFKMVVHPRDYREYSTAKKASEDEEADPDIEPAEEPDEIEGGVIDEGSSEKFFDIGVYYRGRLSVKSYAPENDYSRITIEYRLEPEALEDLNGLTVELEWYDKGGSPLLYENYGLVGMMPVYDNPNDPGCSASDFVMYDGSPIHIITGNEMYKKATPKEYPFPPMPPFPDIVVPDVVFPGVSWDYLALQSGIIINPERDYGRPNYINATSVGGTAFYGCSFLSAANFPVCTTIGNQAFNRCSSLSAVNFPACMTIGYTAFYSCSSLSAVSFPACTTIGEGAFDSCSLLSAVNFPVCTTIGDRAFSSCTSLSVANFPVCTTIGDHAFHWCYSLSTVNFPACTTIGDHAFHHCCLSAVSFQACTTIGDAAFRSCSSLSAVSFPACTTIGDWAFYDCSSLSAVSFPVCMTIGDDAFRSCSSLSVANFPACTTIGMTAFCDCSSLSAVNFPVCTTIGDGAFYMCRLSVANFPVCTTIGQDAFLWCSSLSIVSFPVCTAIWYGAFNRCSSLSTVSFPVCTTILDRAFYMCRSLSTVSFPACTTIGSSVFYYCSSLSTVSFPVCTTIGNEAFSSCRSLSAVNFPVCTTIGSSVFYYCSSLSTVSFPACTTIETDAFYGCSSLSSVSFPACMTIGSNAFCSCSSLSAIYLGPYYSGGLVASLGQNAFKYTMITSSTGSIYVPESLVDIYKSAEGWSYYSDRIFRYDPGGGDDDDDDDGLLEIRLSNATTVYSGFTNIVSVYYFPGEASTVVSSAFANCLNLKTVNARECTVIENEAFKSCKLLKEVIAESCTSIGASAFKDCTLLPSGYFPNCSTIGSDAFAGCTMLSQIFLPSCTSIGSDAFKGCEKLNEVYLYGDSVPTLENSTVFESTALNTGGIYVAESLVGVYKLADNWSIYSDYIHGADWDDNGRLYSDASTMRRIYTGIGAIEEVDYPNMQTIATSAFKDCINLSSISIPNCVTIKNDAFNGCQALTSLSAMEFPACVTIENSAFKGCYNITDIVLPSCKTIGPDSFRNCVKLSCVLLPGGTMASLSGTYTFSGTMIGTCGIFVPESLLPTYKTFEPWAPYSSNIYSIYWDSNGAATIQGSVIDETVRPSPFVKSLILPDISYIGSSTLAGFNKLEAISIPQCYSAGELAFRGCSLISSIDLFAFRSVESQYSASCYIDATAFSGCTNLSEIRMYGETVPTITDAGGTGMSYPFYATLITSSTGSIFVPSSVVDTYKADSIFSYYSNVIYPITT